MAAITIGSNIDSLRALSRLGSTSNQLSSTFERLSSGMRITRASSDAAGLAVASTMSAAARVYGRGVQNLNDGISALNIANGAVNELSSIVQRLRELATQSANGSLSLTQRKSLDTEAYALTNEYNRIIQSTRFNRMNLIDGSNNNIGIQAGFGSQSLLTIDAASGLARTVGTGSYATRVTTDTTLDPLEGADFGDLNGDGIPDMVAFDGTSSRLNIRFGSASGTFGAATTMNLGTVGFSSGSVALGDFNGDGALDIAAVKSNVGLLYTVINKGDGTFNTPVGYTTTFTSFSELAAADINGDGKDDLLGIYAGSGVWGYLNKGDGTFNAQATLFKSSLAPTHLQVGDVNGDGRQDLVVSTASTVECGLGRGDGTFGTAISMGSGVALGSLTLGDFDHDGLMDLVAGSDAGAYISFFRGNGTGSFQPRISRSSTGSLGVTAGDMNNDGYLDIITREAVHFGNGDGTFGAAATHGGGIDDKVKALDMNGDGVLEILGIYVNGPDWTEVIFSNTAEVNTIDRLNLTTSSGALDALDRLEDISSHISAALSAIGSLQSRFAVAAENLFVRKENYLTAASRIMDADIAVESANLVRLQILQNSGALVLAHANQRQELALDLLRF